MSSPNREGKDFEDSFQNTCKVYNIHVEKLPKSGGFFVSKTQFINATIICDFIIGYKNKVALVDTKTFKTNVCFAFTRKRKIYKQIEKLAKFQAGVSEGDIIKACYVIYLRKEDAVCVFLAQQLLDLKPKEGLSKKDAIKVIGTGSNFHPLKIF